MPLCSPRSCGCAISSETLDITGSGGPGDPYVIEEGWLLRLYGVNKTPADGQLQIVGGTSSVSTDASGFATVSYGVTFLAPGPALTAWGGWSLVPMNPNLVGGSPGLSSFQFLARNAAGAIIVSTEVRINWTAIGLVA